MNGKPYAKRAVAFAEALVKQQFEAAYAMLGDRLREELSPAQLRSRYEAMMGAAVSTAPVVELVTTMEQWPGREPDDAGWAYVAIAGDFFSEAVTVVVEHAGNGFAIRDIEWGRP